MNYFEPGKKVVYNGKGTHPYMSFPTPYTEILTLKKMHVRPDDGAIGWELEEYNYSIDGTLQVFKQDHLIPLEDWEQAETMTAELVEETLIPVEI